MKKRILATLLTLVIILGLCVPVSAAVVGLTPQAEEKLIQLLLNHGYSEEDIQEELSAEWYDNDFTNGPQHFYGRNGSDDFWVNDQGVEVFQDLMAQDYVIYPFRDGYASIDQGLGTGYINAAGEIIIPCQYGRYSGAGDTLAGHIHNGRVWVLKENYSRVSLSMWEWEEPETWEVAQLDLAGNMVVPWKTVDAFANGLHMLNDGGYCGDCDVIEDTTQPAIEVPITPNPNTAYASTQSVLVDGNTVTFECYALKDQSGNMTNYIKLRDLAMHLNGTAAQFQVGWDGNVTITTQSAYTPNGSELSTPYSGDRASQETTATTMVNGQATDLAAFVLNDDAGGGYTYYQLRDLGKTLGFNVGWAADKGIFVETDKLYDVNN